MKKLTEDFLDVLSSDEITQKDDAVQKTVSEFDWRMPIVYEKNLEKTLDALFKNTLGISDYKIEVQRDEVEVHVGFDAFFKSGIQAWRFLVALANIIAKNIDNSQTLIFCSVDGNFLIDVSKIRSVVSGRSCGSVDATDRFYCTLLAIIDSLSQHKQTEKVFEFVEEQFSVSKNLIYTYVPSEIVQFSIDVRRELRDLPINTETILGNVGIYMVDVQSGYKLYQERHFGGGQMLQFGKSMDVEVASSINARVPKQILTGFQQRSGCLFFVAYMGVISWGIDKCMAFLMFNTPDLKEYFARLEQVTGTQLNKKVKKLIKDEYAAGRIIDNDDEL